MSDEQVLVIACQPDTVSDLAAALRDVDANVQSSVQRNLDGVVVEQCVVVATVAIQAAPRIVDALTRFAARRHLTSVSVGDIEFKNARVEDLPAIMDALTGVRNGLEED